MFHVAVSLLAYLLALVALRHVWPTGILFYQGLSLACGAAVLHWAWLRWRLPEAHGSERVKDALLVFALAYGFMFTVPTTADRSYSVQMIQLLARHPEGLAEAQLQDHFREQFIRQGGVNRRVKEQLASGTVEIAADHTVHLTPRGERIAWLSGWTCRLFACQSAL